MAPEDGSAYYICIKIPGILNCFYEENIALKEKIETSSAKEENKKVAEINYVPPKGKPKKNRELRFSKD